MGCAMNSSALATTTRQRSHSHRTGRIEVRTESRRSAILALIDPRLVCGSRCWMQYRSYPVVIPRLAPRVGQCLTGFYGKYRLEFKEVAP